MRWASSLLIVAGLIGCSSSSAAIDSDGECIASFRDAAQADGELVSGVDAAEAWGSFQGSNEWEGETPVCWVNFSSASSCTGFMFDLEGRWAEPKWIRDDLMQPIPCPFEGVGESFSL